MGALYFPKKVFLYVRATRSMCRYFCITSEVDIPIRINKNSVEKGGEKRHRRFETGNSMTTVFITAEEYSWKEKNVLQH